MSQIAGLDNEASKHLIQHLEKLSELCKLYDEGKHHFAQDIATKMRVMFHQPLGRNGKPPRSVSVLNQLELADKILFYDTHPQLPVFRDNNGKQVLQNVNYSDIKLLSPVLCVWDANFQFIPRFTRYDITANSKVNFDVWWNKMVIPSQKETEFSRKDLVLHLADTDGGAHVDTELDEDYKNLTRNNSMGFRTGNSSLGTSQPINDPVPPTIRQMAHEVLASFNWLNTQKTNPD